MRRALLVVVFTVAEVWNVRHGFRDGQPNALEMMNERFTRR